MDIPKEHNTASWQSESWEMRALRDSVAVCAYLIDASAGGLFASCRNRRKLK
jgi:hypothetical protein